MNLDFFINQVEKGNIPDFLVKAGIRNLCSERLKWAKKQGPDGIKKHNLEWVEKLKNSPIALVPEKANEQHYEVPPEFFVKSLGENLKYSCGYWESGAQNLNESEIDMLDMYLKRAELKDGMDILELGCGWGSLTFHMANQYPKSKITAVSNSNDQRKFIQSKCAELMIDNIDVITCDMNDFTIDKKFDRVVSIEMFEHMRNYKELLKRVSSFMKDGAKLFVHIFSHKSMVYPYEDRGPSDWMAREFFSGGLMPSHDLLSHFQDDLKLENSWKINGVNYKKTSYAWLNKMDANKNDVIEIFKKTYGEDTAFIWYNRWRIFFMACGEMFGLKNGEEWGVSHYLFSK